MLSKGRFYAVQHVLIVQIIQNSISCKHNNIIVLNRVLIEISMSRRIIISTALVGIVEAILLLFGSEKYLQAALLMRIWSYYQIARVS